MRRSNRCRGSSQTGLHIDSRDRCNSPERLDRGWECRCGCRTPPKAKAQSRDSTGAGSGAAAAKPPPETTGPRVRTRALTPMVRKRAHLSSHIGLLLRNTTPHAASCPRPPCPVGGFLVGPRTLQSPRSSPPTCRPMESFWPAKGSTSPFPSLLPPRS